MAEEQKQRWVKIPGPGEFRGEGTWTKLEDTDYADTESHAAEPLTGWEWLQHTQFLPTYEGENPEMDYA